MKICIFLLFCAWLTVHAHCCRVFCKGTRSSNPENVLETILAKKTEAETNNKAIKKIVPLITKLITSLADLSMGIAEASNQAASKENVLETILANETEAETNNDAIKKIVPLITKLITSLADLSMGIAEASNQAAPKENILETILAKKTEAETNNKAIKKIVPLITKLITSLADLSMGIADASNQAASKAAMFVSSALPPIINAASKITPSQVVSEAKSAILGISKLVKLISGTIRDEISASSISPVDTGTSQKETKVSQSKNKEDKSFIKPPKIPTTGSANIPNSKSTLNKKTSALLNKISKVKSSVADIKKGKPATIPDKKSKGMSKILPNAVSDIILKAVSSSTGDKPIQTASISLLKLVDSQAKLPKKSNLKTISETLQIIPSPPKILPGETLSTITSQSSLPALKAILSTQQIPNVIKSANTLLPSTVISSISPIASTAPKIPGLIPSPATVLSNPLLSQEIANTVSKGNSIVPDILNNVVPAGTPNLPIPNPVPGINILNPNKGPTVPAMPHIVPLPPIPLLNLPPLKTTSATKNKASNEGLPTTKPSDSKLSTTKASKGILTDLSTPKIPLNENIQDFSKILSPLGKDSSVLPPVFNKLPIKSSKTIKNVPKDSTNNPINELKASKKLKTKPPTKKIPKKHS